MLQRYGISLGRLWIPWPYIEWRDLWVGVYIKERYWESGERHQLVYICIVPTIVLLLDWRS